MHDRMPVHDRQVVAAIVDGNADGLATAFDGYAPSLYAYCRSRLTEPADAAVVVQDTFIIAASAVSGLRQPERLRAWLFAVARTECQRRLQAAGPSAPLYAAAEAMDDTGTLTAVTEQAELRAQVRAAVAELNPAERELSELSLWHQFYGSDLADVLGVPRGQAQALAATARSHLERSLGPALVARFEQWNCAGLSAVLHGSGMRATLRWRIRRHIKHCEQCSEREHRDVGLAMMPDVLGVPVLPAGLRQQTLGQALSASPGAAAYRDEVMDRAAPLGNNGFPKQLTAPSALRWRGTPVLAAAVAASALALLGGGMYYVATAAIHTVSAPAAGAHSTPTPGATGTGRSGNALAKSPPGAAPLHQPIYLPSASGSTGPPPLVSPAVTAPGKQSVPGRSASPTHSSPGSATPISGSTRPTTPTPTRPAPTTPAPTRPAPTTPAPTRPAPTTPAPTTPAAAT